MRSARTVASRPDRAHDADAPAAGRRVASPASPLQAAGNQQALRALGIRPKTTLSQPSDPEEQEADRAAEAFTAGRSLRRKCDSSGCAEDSVMRSAAAAAPPPGARGAQPIAALRDSSGVGIPAAERSAYERFFDADLSHVRLHSGERSTRAAGAIGARAFTLGSDVHFAAGSPPASTHEGRKLLAHELAHVVQQDASTSGDGQIVHRDTLQTLPSTLPSSSLVTVGGGPVDLSRVGGPSTQLGRPWGSQFPLPGYGSGRLSDFDIPDPDELRFTERHFGPRVVLPENRAPSCSRGGCHEPLAPPSWAPPPDRRATEERLVQWAREMGERFLLTDANQLMLQLYPGQYSGMVAALRQQLLLSIMGTHEFEGSDAARRKGADALAARWEEIRPGLEEELETWFIGRFAEAIQRAPKGAEVVSDPDEILRVFRTPYADATSTGRWGQLAKAGERWGAMVIADIAQPELTEGTVWFRFAGDPWWLYSMSTFDFRAWDPFVAEVARQTAENARFAAELMPFLIKAFGFGLALSSNIGFVIAGILIQEFGEEMARDVRGEKHRSLSEFFTDAGKAFLIDRVTNIVAPLAFKAAGSALRGFTRTAVSAEERLAVEAVEEKAADAIRREVAAHEAPQLAKAAQSGVARPVEDAALRSEGYVLEVEVIVDGRLHLYRQLENGRWCRFSTGICDLDMGETVANAMKTPSERALENIGEKFGAMRKDQSLIVQAYERAAKAGAKKGGRIEVDVLTAEERQVLDELAPGEDAANLTIGELKKLAQRKVESGFEYKALLKEEADLLRRIASENLPIAQKLRRLLKQATKDAVKRESRGIDFISQGSPIAGESLSVEHIVPVREMAELPGVQKLGPDDLIEYANLRRNLVPMTLGANTLRKDRSYALILARDFSKYGYTAQRIGYMAAEEETVRKYLIGWIAGRTTRRRTL